MPKQNKNHPFYQKNSTLLTDGLLEEDFLFEEDSLDLERFKRSFKSDEQNWACQIIDK